MKKLFLAMLACTVASPAMAATTIDFSSMPTGPVTTVNGVTFGMSGGPNTATTPVVTNVFDDELSRSLTNSDTNDYPTSQFLTATFSSLASAISFTFNNYGNNGTSAYTARDTGGNVISTGSLGSVNGFDLVSVAGSGIRSLTWTNGQGGSNWQFGVGELNFTTAAAVPEPATWAMMLLGFGAIGGAMRRRGAVSTRVTFA